MSSTPEQFSSFSSKTKCFFFFIFHLFFCQKVSDKLLTFWLACLLSNPCSSRLVFNMLCAVIYACAHARVWLRVFTFVSVIVEVVVVGTSCEVSCVIFCLVVGYDGRLNALAVHAGAILCSVVSQPPLPCLSTATDHTGWQASLGRRLPRHPSLRGLRLF